MSTGPTANVAFPTRYRFGWGRRAELVAEARAAGITRALVVTDPGVLAQAWMEPVLAAVRAELGGVLVSAISSNPTEEEIVVGAATYRDAGCDGVIAIGGGSPMDAAKLIALLAEHEPAPLAEYAIGGARARTVRRDDIAPIVAMPTTSGTGSELSTGAVVTDHAARVKWTVLHPALLPRAVVADPEVTVGVPAAITAATGLDALTHAIEALCAPSYHPMCDGIALEAIRMLFANLPRAIAAPADPTARSHLMMAASMAAVAFQKGLGLVHAMAHPLGAATNVHHGLANAVLLPLVLELNAPAIAAPCARILGILDEAPDPDPVARVVSEVRALANAVGLPARLPVPDIAPAELARLALAEKVYLATNPRRVSVEEIARVYERAFVIA
jgi:alcohol dehydrogenase class IV